MKSCFNFIKNYSNLLFVPRLKTDKEIKLMMERMLTDYDPKIRPDYSGKIYQS